MKVNVVDSALTYINYSIFAKGLQNIVIKLSTYSILRRILSLAARKFTSTLVELRLGQNKILGLNFGNVFALAGNLKAIDLGNNWLNDLDDIKDLQKLGLKSLRLDGNPLCAKYSFAGEYIQAVKSRFPQLTTLVSWITDIYFCIYKDI